MGQFFGDGGVEQFHDHASDFVDFFGIGFDHQVFFDGIDTRGDQAGALIFGNFHEAHATDADRFELLVIAKGGDVDIVLAGDLQEGGAEGGFDFFSIDFDEHGFHGAVLFG